MCPHNAIPRAKLPSRCNSARESALFPLAAPCPFSILGRTLHTRANDVKVMIVDRAISYSLKKIFIFVTMQIGEYILNNDHCRSYNRLVYFPLDHQAYSSVTQNPRYPLFQVFHPDCILYTIQVSTICQCRF